MVSPALREAQWRDDGSLAAAALGGGAAGQRRGQRADGAAEGATGAATHGHGRVAAPALAGALYSLSTDRTLPTNRSLTPRRLQAAAPRAHSHSMPAAALQPCAALCGVARGMHAQDELGRKGDWLFPGRVDLFWQGPARSAAQTSEVEHAEGVEP